MWRLVAIVRNNIEPARSPDYFDLSDELKNYIPLVLKHAGNQYTSVAVRSAQSSDECSITSALKHPHEPISRIPSVEMIWLQTLRFPAPRSEVVRSRNPATLPRYDRAMRQTTQTQTH